jgi:hypothetical protein
LGVLVLLWAAHHTAETIKQVVQVVKISKKEKYEPSFTSPPRSELAENPSS